MQEKRGVIMKRLCDCGCGNPVSNRRRKFIRGHQMQAWRAPEDKKCTKCKKTLSIDNFYKRAVYSRLNDTKYYRCTPNCKKCERKKSKKRDCTIINETRRKKKKSIRLNNDIPSYIRYNIHSYKVRAKKCKVIFDLTKDELISKYLIQEGKCYYTGTTLILSSKQGDPDNISLDRRDPSKGYTIDNVVWCTYRINIMKGNFSVDKFYDTMKLILSNSSDTA